jgi:hypothetical protein
LDFASNRFSTRKRNILDGIQDGARIQTIGYQLPGALEVIGQGKSHTCSAGIFSDNTVLRSSEFPVAKKRTKPASEARCSNTAHSLLSKRLEMWRNMLQSPGFYDPTFAFQ